MPLFPAALPGVRLGVLLMLALPAARSNPWLLFLWAALSATGAEYLMDLFYDRVLGVSFWDYSHLPLNLHGRVCLLFSFFWGILGLIAVRLVHPLAAELVSRIPQAVTLPAALFLALDIGFSVFVLRRDGTTDALMWYRRLPAAVPGTLSRKGKGRTELFRPALLTDRAAPAGSR